PLSKQVRLRKRKVEHELTRLAASGDYSSTAAAAGRSHGGGFAISVKFFGGSVAPHYWVVLRQVGATVAAIRSEWPTIQDLCGHGYLMIKAIGGLGLNYGLAGGFPHVR